ncbi:hypothetical protein [Bifidobacterium fermentum]|uniref:Uncharacterized protein n=1 Tax=Bifidobacterium fermentum TaxID=3059035 RepID=A0AB39UK56_9BIFI
MQQSKVNLAPSISFQERFIMSDLDWFSGAGRRPWTNSSNEQDSLAKQINFSFDYVEIMDLRNQSHSGYRAVHREDSWKAF